MEIEIFTAFISNCLRVQALCVESAPDSLKNFEEKNCFDSALQPMYTAEYLSFLIDNSKENVFYEITDYVGTCLLMFRFRDCHFIVGPYVKSLTTDQKLYNQLFSFDITANIFQQIKLYQSHFPLLDYTYLTDFILAAMRSLVPMTADYNHRFLKGFHEEIEQKNLTDAAETSYFQILKRYEYENYLLEKIRSGDVDGVNAALFNSTSDFLKTSDTSTQSYYATNHEGFTIMRTLARKAAELGGCPVVKIDEITQEAIQRVNQVKKANDISNIIGEMVFKLTKAVEDSKEVNKYSLLIKNIVIYIESNYSKDISLGSIAKESYISKEHLSRQFKKETGRTLTGYITMIRTREAAKLLKSTKLPIADISTFVGYPDSNYFVKVFKKNYALTPSEYRNSH